jgi:hypothetical protein
MVNETIQVDKEIQVPKVILEDREIQIPENVYETKTVKVPRQRVITEYEEVFIFFLLSLIVLDQVVTHFFSIPSRSQLPRSEFIKSKSHALSKLFKRFSIP